VPSHLNVLVGYSLSRLAMGVRFGVLLFDGLHVSLVSHDGTTLLEGSGPELSVAPVGGTRLGLTSRRGVSVDVVGPQTGWDQRPPAPNLMERYGAVVVPDADLEALSRWATRSPGAPGAPGAPASPAGDALRQQIVWRGVLMTMLAARGARVA
jgi:hypothetical protein